MSTQSRFDTAHGNGQKLFCDYEKIGADMLWGTELKGQRTLMVFKGTLLC